MGDFFVMLTKPDSTVSLLVDEKGDIKMYVLKMDARQAAMNTDLGLNFGYEIFELGSGSV